MSFIRGPFDFIERVKVSFTKPSMTKQSFKDECDINNILSRYKKNMGINFLDQYAGVIQDQFADFSFAEDYHTGLQKIREAEGVFEAMPATLRSRFDNDPGKFLDFVSDKGNFDEAVKLGLMKPGVQATTTPVV